MSAPPTPPSSGKRQRQPSPDTGSQYRNRKAKKTEVVSDLVFPNHAACNPRTKHLEQRATTIGEGLLVILEKHSSTGQSINDMALNAKQTLQKPEPAKPVIMLIGATGAGKSSIINRLLDDNDATKASAADGKAVTCGATTFEEALPDQKEPYEAELIAFNRTDRRAFLHQHCDAFIRYHFESNPSWDPSERQEARERAYEASNTLFSLFKQKLQVSTVDGLKASFPKNGRDELPAFVDILNKWCDSILSSDPSYNFYEDGDRTVCRIRDKAAEGLNQKLKRFVHDPPKKSSALPLWMLIESARKTVPRRPLTRYVTFLDLPGTADANTTRSAAAFRFVQSSHALWALAPISRAASEAALQRTLQRHAARFKSHVTLVATQSDCGLDQNLAAEYESEGIVTGANQQLQEEIDAIDEELEVLEVATDLSQDEIDSQAHRLMNQRLRAESQQLDALACARKNIVTEEMYKSYQKYVGDPSALSVFCVSSDLYWKGKENKSGVVMSLDATNIPALCTHALHVAGDASFAASSVHVYLIVALLKATTLWTQEGSTDRLQPHLEALRKLPSGLDAIANKHSSQCRDLLDGFIGLIHDLRAEEATNIADAMVIKNEIQPTWHHATARAFFTHYGNHRTSLKDEVWNERFLESQKEIIDDGYLTMKTAQKDLLRQPVKELIGTIKNIIKKLQKDPMVPAEQLEPLRTLLESYIHNIRRLQDQHLAQLEKVFTDVKDYATLDEPGCYFAQAARPMYESSRQEKGPGCTQPMFNHLTSFLTGTDNTRPFRANIDHLREGLLARAGTVAKALNTDLKQTLQKLIADLEHSLRRQPRTEQEALAVQEIAEYLERSKPEIDELDAGMREVRERYGLQDEERYLEEVSFFQQTGDLAKSGFFYLAAPIDKKSESMRSDNQGRVRLGSGDKSRRKEGRTSHDDTTTAMSET